MTVIMIEQDVATPRHGLRNVTQPSRRLAALAFGHYQRFATWRRKRAQERHLASLPMDMRKDFGWPGPDRR